MEVGGQSHPPAALRPGITRYPLYRSLDRTQGHSGWVRKISPPPRFDPRTVEPVASCYTDWAMRVHRTIHKHAEKLKCYYISIVKPTRRTSVSNLFYFGITFHVSDGLSVHHQQLKTPHTVTGTCQTNTAVYLLSKQTAVFV